MQEDFKPTNLKERPKHLAEGVKPIMTCLGTAEDYGKEWKEVINLFYRPNSTAENINFKAHSTYLNDRQFLNSGEKTYVISRVDGLDKFSEKYFDCTGVIVSGIDKITGENISFMSHQRPSFFLSDENIEGTFQSHLKQRILELKERCVPGSIDAVIAGGDVNSDLHSLMSDRTTLIGAYLKSIEILSSLVKENLGFEPVVINGPKQQKVHGSGGDDLYYDNKNRRLYLVRPRVNPSVSGQYAGQVEKDKPKWQEEEYRKDREEREKRLSDLDP